MVRRRRRRSKLRNSDRFGGSLVLTPRAGSDDEIFRLRCALPRTPILSVGKMGTSVIGGLLRAVEAPSRRSTRCGIGRWSSVSCPRAWSVSTKGFSTPHRMTTRRSAYQRRTARGANSRRHKIVLIREIMECLDLLPDPGLIMSLQPGHQLRNFGCRF